MFPRKKRLWWLPLVLIMVCVLGTWLYSLIQPGETDPAGGLIRQEIVDGQSYDVLERESSGTFSLHKVCFCADPESGAEADVRYLPYDGDQGLPEGFAQAQIMSQDLYEAYCETWGLTPEYQGRVAVIACAAPGAARVELQVGDILQAADTAVIWLRDRAYGEGNDAPGFVLVFPVEKEVQKLDVCPLYSSEEVEALRQTGQLPQRLLDD